MGEVFTLTNEKYEKIAQDVINQYDLTHFDKSQKKEDKDKKWQYGTAIFKSFNSR